MKRLFANKKKLGEEEEENVGNTLDRYIPYYINRITTTGTGSVLYLINFFPVRYIYRQPVGL
jgi:hypothetical protein